MSYSLAFTQSLYMMLYIAGKIERGLYDFIPTQVISQELNIPPSTAGMILRRLNRAGLIETREGASGGVRLALPPEEITVLTLFMAIEQEHPMFQTNMQFRITGAKPSGVQQTVIRLLTTAESAMKDQLQVVTLRDLMNTIG